MNLLKNIKKIYMIGIKGTGMSALAVNLKSMGINVVGSDYAESFFTDILLKHNGIKVISPFSSNNIPADADLVVVSTAYNNKNIELREAKRRKLPLLTYPQALGLLTRRLPSVAICGSHGKTTTSGALGFLMSKTSYNPVINVGSIVPQLLRYKARKPKLLVFEADEYQNKFEYFYPKIVILTNIDYDHPDYFKIPAQYKRTFKNFVKRIPGSGLLIYCADDKNCRDVAGYTKCKKISYGFSKYADCQVKNVIIKKGGTKFNLWSSPDQRSLAMTSKLLGNHNALNLAAAVICAKYLKIPENKIKQAIFTFAGTKRRLEIIKKFKLNGRDCILIDDYGHHPTEIKATVATLKTAYPDKTLWTVFQPHTFSRTEALFNDFVKCFAQSDKTVILDIYASKREKAGKIHSRKLVKAISSENVFYKSGIEQAAEFIKKKIETDSIILTIGAGNVWELSKLL